MNIKSTFKGLAIAASLLVTPNLFGQTADTTKKAEAPLTITGEVDAYFRGTANKVNGSKTSYTSQQGGFGLGMANVAFAKDNGKVGFVADFMFGQRGDETNYSYIGTAATIKQLFITYKPTDKIKFTAGNFMTFFGYELAEASNNLNYSMSYNYTNGPFFHTGVKADIAFTDKLAGMIGVFNQTDSKGYYGLRSDYQYLNTHKKMTGGQLSYVNGGFKIYLNGLVGQGGDSASLTTLDVTTSYQVTDKLGAGFNFTSKSSSKEKTDNAWNASALYLNYAFSPKFVLAARGELFNDKDGWVYSATDNVITAFTLSGNIKIDAFTIIPEIRFDSAKKAIWEDSAKKAQKSETSFILAAVYKF
jgi:Putative beta-barrel porin-2, OmpL-like. bbp2